MNNEFRFLPDGVIYEWTYDAWGNVLTKTANGALMQVNAYDSLNQPISRALPAWQNRVSVYEYDAAGNRVKLTEPEGDTLYEYDANGSQITKTDQYGATAYEYDYQNLIKKITYPDGSINTFQNCRCGPVRRMKQDSRGTTKYLYDFDETRLLHEADETWTPHTHYTMGPRIDEILKKKQAAEGGKWKKVYYLYDALGSVVALTDEAGGIVASYKYAPFGKILSAEGPEASGNPFTFTGREYDQDSGLYYYRARYMDPRIGRFTTKDPLMDMLIQQSNPVSESEDIPIYGSGCSSCGGNYTPAIARWLSRDPIGEDGFCSAIKQFNPEIIPQKDNKPQLSETQIQLLLRRGLDPLQIISSAVKLHEVNNNIKHQSNLYFFCANNPIMFMDPYGLETPGPDDAICLVCIGGLWAGCAAGCIGSDDYRNCVSSCVYNHDGSFNWPSGYAGRRCSCLCSPTPCECY